MLLLAAQDGGSYPNAQTCATTLILCSWTLKAYTDPVCLIFQDYVSSQLSLCPKFDDIFQLYFKFILFC